MGAAALDLSRPTTASGAAVARPAGAPGQLRLVQLLRVALALMITAQLARVPVLSSGAKDAPILLNDLLVTTVALAGLILALRKRTLTLDRPAAAGLAFAATGAISALLAVPKFGLSTSELVFSLAYLVRWLMYFSVYLVAINSLRRGDVNPVWRTLEGAILVFAAFGIFQSIFLPGFAQIVYPDSRVYVDWDYQGHRLVSTFLDPNFAGMFIVVGILVLLARLALGAPVDRWKLILLFAALLLTVSRSAILGLFAGGVMILAVVGLSRRILRLGAVLGVLLIPALPFLVQYAVSFNKLTIDGSAMTRVVQWLRALTVFADNPIVGVGFNTYGFVQGEYGFRNVGNSSFGLDGGILFIAVVTGIVGVAIYGAMVVLVLRRYRRIWRCEDATAEERGLALGAAATTVALLVHSLFLNSLLYPFLMETIWVLWALGFVMARDLSARPGPAQPRGSRLHLERVGA